MVQFRHAIRRILSAITPPLGGKVSSSECYDRNFFTCFHVNLNPSRMFYFYKLCHYSIDGAIYTCNKKNFKCNKPSLPGKVGSSECYDLTFAHVSVEHIFVMGVLCILLLKIIRTSEMDMNFQLNLNGVLLGRNLLPVQDEQLSITNCISRTL